MANVWFIGNNGTRIITSADWLSAGITAPTITWSEANAWSIPTNMFNSQQLAILEADSEFLLGQTGPRTLVYPAPGGGNPNASALVYYQAIRDLLAADAASVAAINTRLDAPQIVSNWKLSNTTKLRASLAKAQLGTGFSTHAVIGDSLSSAFTGSAFDFPGSWWRRLWRGLVASGVPSAGTGRVAMTDYSGAPSNPVDPRITKTGTWNLTDTWFGSNATAATITFTSDVAGTVAEVMWLDQAAAKPFTVSIDGGAPATVMPTGTWTRTTYAATGLANTTHTVTVAVSAGGAPFDNIFLGFQVRQASGIRFDNLCIKYGIAAHDIISSPDDLGPRQLAVTYSSDADVVWIALGANDLGTGRTAAQAVADISAIRALWPSADCVLIIEPDTDDGEGSYQDYVTAMRALSVTLDCPLIDLSLRYGSKAQITAAQLYGADNVHLNSVGQSDWGAVALGATGSVQTRCPSTLP